MKSKSRLTLTQQNNILKFLSAQLDTLKGEDRIGRLHLNNDESKNLIEKVIIAMAETL